MNVKDNKGEYFSEEFRAFFDAYLDSLKSAQAKKNYRSCVCDITQKLKKDFLLITKEDAQSYFDTVSDRKKTTNSVRLGIFRAVAKKADEQFGTCLKDSFFGLTVTQELKKLSISDTPQFEEIDKVLKDLRKKNDLTTFLIIALSLETALSTRELTGLDFGNIQQDKNGTHLIKLPSRSNEDYFRYIPLKESTMKLISDVAKQRGTITGTLPVFVNNKGERMSERTMQQYVKRAFTDAGAKGPSSVASLGMLAKSLMLKGGATTEALSKQLDVTGIWFFRLNDVVKELDTAASSYNHLEVKW